MKYIVLDNKQESKSQTKVLLNSLSQNFVNSFKISSAFENL